MHHKALQAALDVSYVPGKAGPGNHNAVKGNVSTEDLR